MRWMCLILVGVFALGCKDPPAKPRESGAGSTPTPARAAAGSAQARAHEGPTLAVPASSGTSPEDRAWADATEKAIAATAPDLEGVTCTGQSCTASLPGDTEAALATKTAALQSDDSLRSAGARSITFGAAETKDGRLSLPVTIAFDRTN